MDRSLATGACSIREPLSCGIRAIDRLYECGRGKHRDFAQWSREEHPDRHDGTGNAADMTVLALVGERGREVANSWKSRGRGTRRAVLLSRLPTNRRYCESRCACGNGNRGALCELGKNVLLIVDFTYTFCNGTAGDRLAAGEPPTAKVNAFGPEHAGPSRGASGEFL